MEDLLLFDDEQPAHGNARFAAYGMYIKSLFAVKGPAFAKAMAAKARYTAYSSDIGEAFRPVVRPWMVTASYGVAVAYIVGDVGYTTYKEYRRPGGDPIRAAAHAATFQGLASLLVPAVVIHQSVHATQRLTKGTRLARWGPTAVGLGIIPFLPSTVDPPVEAVIDRAFEWAWPEAGPGHGHQDHGEGGEGAGAAAGRPHEKAE
mmetsp:Transcript_11256/g.38361  ORF Transcript_11256/g.38361 Transcript_11256/m.38361 type:complete len:204 (+) Transcript_11256:1026-1637(+)